MRKTITLYEYKCDFCGDPMPYPSFQRRVEMQKGRNGQEGIEVCAKSFGRVPGFSSSQEQKDICKECFKNALLDLIETLNEKESTNEYPHTADPLESYSEEAYKRLKNEDEERITLLRKCLSMLEIMHEKGRLCCDDSFAVRHVISIIDDIISSWEGGLKGSDDIPPTPKK